jgi:hypothetical protein
MQRIEGKPINFVITTELLEEVDRIALRFGLSRSEMLRNLIDMSCYAIRKYESVGLIKGLEIFDKLRKTVDRSVGQQALFNGN